MSTASNCQAVQVQVSFSNPNEKPRSENGMMCRSDTLLWSLYLLCVTTCISRTFLLFPIFVETQVQNLNWLIPFTWYTVAVLVMQYAYTIRSKNVFIGALYNVVMALIIGELLPLLSGKDDKGDYGVPFIETVLRYYKFFESESTLQNAVTILAIILFDLTVYAIARLFTTPGKLPFRKQLEEINRQREEERFTVVYVKGTGRFDVYPNH